MKYSISLLAALAALAACGTQNEKKSDKKDEVAEQSQEKGLEQNDDLDGQKNDDQKDSADAGDTDKADQEIKKNRISEKIFLMNGRYFSETFHGQSPAVSRSLEIRGDSFVSKVVGLAPGTMTVVALQQESGQVVENEDGTVDLIIEESDCEGVPDFVSATARRASWKNLELADGKLNFTFTPFVDERQSSIAAVEVIKDITLTEGQKIERACWYLGADGQLRAGILNWL